MATTETGASSHKVVAHWLTTAMGATSAITVRAARLIDIAVDFGSGTGTVDLEGEYSAKTSATIGDSDWKVIESYTGDTYKVARVAATRRIRLNCSAHGGTGTIAAELTAGNKE
jgi:hypothetical protein